ncbi:MAG: ABC transporter substrate-binding protein, partial [Rhizobiaceae bacterium]
MTHNECPWTVKRIHDVVRPGWSAVCSLLIASMFALSACQSTDLGTGSVQPDFSDTPTTPSPNANGEVHGQGPVRVAMLLPSTAPGNAAAVASEVRNGALLALQDFGQDAIQIVIKDSSGQAASSQSAATEAVREGAAVILGPVFAANVSAASAITQPTRRTMIAFSTDTSVAKRGVYLLSYT